MCFMPWQSPVWQDQHLASKTWTQAAFIGTSLVCLWSREFHPQECPFKSLSFIAKVDSSFGFWIILLSQRDHRLAVARARTTSESATTSNGRGCPVFEFRQGTTIQSILKMQHLFEMTHHKSDDTDEIMSSAGWFLWRSWTHFWYLSWLGHHFLNNIQLIRSCIGCHRNQVCKTVCSNEKASLCSSVQKDFSQHPKTLLNNRNIVSAHYLRRRTTAERP